MRSTILRVSFAAAAALLVAGCCASKEMFTYQRTAASWEPVPAGRSRVVVYAPNRLFDAFGSVFGDMDTSSVRVSFDDGPRLELFERSFRHGHVAAGDHTVVYGDVEPLGSSEHGRRGRLGFTANAGETLFIEITGDGDPVLVPEELARRRLDRLAVPIGDAVAFHD